MTARKRKWDTVLYKTGDFLGAVIVWILFRTLQGDVAPVDSLVEIIRPRFFLEILIVAGGWIMFYTVFDKYDDIYRLSRLATLTRTFFLSFTGNAIAFIIWSWSKYDLISRPSELFLVLFGLHYLVTSLIRMVILTRASRRLKAGKVTYKTLILGGDQNAVDLYEELSGMSIKSGHHFIGFVDSNGNGQNKLSKYLPDLGDLNELEEVIRKYEVEEAIIAIETSEHNRLEGILNVLFDYDDQVLVKIIPDMYDIMLGSVKMNHVFGAVLIEIRQDLMPNWQVLLKRSMDLLVSAIALIILSPLIIYIVIRVKFSSPGPILFRQQRIGLNGVPFHILKFRSMYLGAESNGPQLSGPNDERCTAWGAKMRKWRLDEIPQFWNVIRGDMSLVGPRPERSYYIEKILPEAPHFKQLLRVRPGITSWGQVKFGYASSVEQMVQRMKFDILYIENMSLALDIKIIFYTLIVLLKGQGK